jgi:hypothetical protein
MKPGEVPTALGNQTTELRATRADPAPLLEAARQTASLVRANASRAGHSVQVRVVARGEGVRITVAGPQANRYREMVERQMDAMLPAARAEIRAQLTRGHR